LTHGHVISSPAPPATFQLPTLGHKTPECPASWPEMQTQTWTQLGGNYQKARNFSHAADGSRIAGMLQSVAIAIVADTPVSLITAHYSDQSVTCCQLRGQQANVMGEK